MLKLGSSLKTQPDHNSGFCSWMPVPVKDDTILQREVITSARMRQIVGNPDIMIGLYARTKFLPIIFLLKASNIYAQSESLTTDNEGMIMGILSQYHRINSFVIEIRAVSI